MNFAIVILTYNQPELTSECIKSIQAVKARDFPDKQIFVIHNGSSNEVIQDLRQRYPRFYHVVLTENEGFAMGANAGLRAAFQNNPWVLFLTQDTTLAHFPKAPPAEPCLAAVKVYKRKTEVVGSMGGAVDLETAKHYFCPKASIFWSAFDNPVLKPFVPRTAFWVHQSPFEKVNGFDESLVSIWEDVDFSLRLREEGEMLQLDENTEVIHHRKGFSRRDPWNMRFLYHRNRFAISRRQPRKMMAQALFEVSLFVEWFFILLESAVTNPREAALVFKSYLESFRDPLRSLLEIQEGRVAEPVPAKLKAAEKPQEGRSAPKKKKSLEKSPERKKTKSKNRSLSLVKTEAKTNSQTQTETEPDPSMPRAKTSESSDS